MSGDYKGKKGRGGARTTTTSRPVPVPSHAAAQTLARHLDRRPPTLSEGGGRGGGAGERKRQRGLPSRTGGGDAAVREGASLNRHTLEHLMAARRPGLATGVAAAGTGKKGVGEEKCEGIGESG
jgi:hypothetical protein